MTGSIAKEIAGKWGLAGSTNVVLYGLLAVLVALAVGIGGGWWVGGSLEEGKAATSALSTARADNTANVAYIERQQRVIADSSRRLEAAAARMTKISQEAADARADNQRQFTQLRDQMERALAARPDLAAVHVGSSVLDAWNGANAGRATGSAGAAQPAAGVRPQPAAARPGKPAAGKGR